MRAEDWRKDWWLEGLTGKGNNHGELASSVSTTQTHQRKFQSEVKNMVHMQSLNHTPQGFHSAPFVELRQFFPSEIRVISSFVDRLMRFLHFRPEDGSEIDIETAVREALANAMVRQ